MDGFIGELKYFAGTFAPSNWLFCEGQQLPIQQYTPLYSIIGVQFGGDGKTYFNLPDLRGRVPLCAGQGNNLTNRVQGKIGGNEGIALTQMTMPAHNHTVKCDTGSSPVQMNANPQGRLFAINSGGKEYGSNETGNPMMKSDIVNNEGQSSAHENMPPWLCLHYIICVNGYYPIRP